MIFVSGFNVYPNEIEEMLSAHEKVMEAAVIVFQLFIVKSENK